MGLYSFYGSMDADKFEESRRGLRWFNKNNHLQDIKIEINGEIH